MKRINNTLKVMMINHLSLSALIILLFTAVGCQKEEIIDVANEPFTLSLTTEQSFDGEEPQPMSSVTRSDASHIDNFVVEAYANANCATPANIFNDGLASKATSTDGVFDVKIDRTKDYYLLLWADEGDGTYNTDNLKAVTLNDNKAVSEAFAGKLTIEAGSTAPSTVSLKRAVAKISMRNTLAMEAGKSIEVSYMYYEQYNVATSSSQGSEINCNTTLTTTTAEAGEEFASVWLLAKGAENTTDFTYNYEEQGDNTIENVPYQANRRTNLKGEYYAPEPTPTYAIGDTYPKGSTAIGIVYSVSPDGTSGMVVSLDEATNIKWSTEFENILNCESFDNGLANMRAVWTHDGNSYNNYPALKWCHDKNVGANAVSYTDDATGIWYLPAKDELVTLLGAASSINSALTTIGTALSSTNPYFSSTEDSNELVYGVHLNYLSANISIYKSLDSGDNVPCVRAVLAF